MDNRINFFDNVNKINDTSTTTDDNLEKIKTIQRYMRGKIRTDLHTFCFHEEPLTTVPLVTLPTAYQATLGVRLQKIIDELSEAQAIINSKKLNHFTIISNLQSIIRQNQIMGNKTLKQEKIDFTGNALSKSEITDQDTICFAPAKVDNLAFILNKNIRYSASREFKKNLCSVICDASSLHYPGNNQFFKITDFANTMSFNQTCTINNRLAVTVDRQVGSSAFNMSIEFDGVEFSQSLKHAELFFYGHAEDINRFCLTKPLHCFVPKNNAELNPSEINFLSYLNLLSDDELRKIFIIIGQAITYFSEYNFHSYCSLDDIRINEIRLYDQKIKYQLQHLDPDQYKAFLTHFANSEWDAPLLKQCETPLKNEENLNKHRDLSCDFNDYEDFSDYPASLFNGHSYLETRHEVNNIDDSIERLYHYR